MIPVFVINLDRRPDRMKFVTGQLDRIGLKAQRVAAVDAEAVEMTSIPRVDLVGGTMLSRRLDQGAAACILSHFKAMQAIVDSGAEAGLILEDDVALSSELPLFLESIAWWPAGTKLIKLDANQWGRRNWRLLSPALKTKAWRRELRHVRMVYDGGAAYLLRTSVAAELLDQCFEIAIPIDVLLYDLRISQVARRLQPLVVVPGLVHQVDDGFESDIDRWRKAAKPNSFARRRLRDIRLAPYGMRSHIQRLVGRAEKVPVAFRDRT